MTKRKALVALLAVVVCAALTLAGYAMFRRWFGNKNITYKYDVTGYANPLMGYAIGGQEFCQGVGSISLIAA